MGCLSMFMSSLLNIGFFIQISAFYRLNNINKQIIPPACIVFLFPFDFIIQFLFLIFIQKV